MADLLHNWFTTKCNFNGQDFTFKRFKSEWLFHRMNFIFLIKHKGEPLKHFMQECNSYLINRMYYNFVNDKRSLVHYQISIYCIYILYVLITQQPCFENNSAASYIFMPEYVWNTLSDLIQFAENQNLSDLQKILKHMMRNHYFVYCLEEPIPYSTTQTDPYSKNGKVYCHGTRSRIVLTPKDLVSVMDVPMLASHKNKYQQALRKCGSEFADYENADNNGQDAFISRLRDIRSKYQQKLVKLQKYRNNGYTQLNEVQFPLQFEKPAAISAHDMEEYYRCCDGYQAAINVFTLDRASMVANEIDAEMNGDKKKDEKKNGEEANQQNENDILMNDAMKSESERTVSIDPMLVLPELGAQNNDFLQFTSMPLPENEQIIDNNHNHNNNHNENDDLLLQPINNQQTLLFGNDHNMNDDEDGIGDDSSTDDEQMNNVQTTSEVQKESDEKDKKEPKKTDLNEEQKEEKVEEKVEEEVVPDKPKYTEEQLKQFEEQRTMREISERNNHKTLDILRSLEQMEESVTNKKREKSTIEELNINWKKYRRLEQQKGKKKKETKKKTNDKKKNAKAKGSGRGRGRGRPRGRGRKPQPLSRAVHKNDDDDDDSSSLSEEIDFGDIEEGAFDHLNINASNQKRKKRKKCNPKEEPDDAENQSIVSIMVVVPKKEPVPIEPIITNTQHIERNDFDIQMEDDKDDIMKDELQPIQEKTDLIVDNAEINEDTNANEEDQKEPDNDTDALLAKLDGFSAFLGGLE